MSVEFKSDTPITGAQGDADETTQDSAEATSDVIDQVGQDPLLTHLVDAVNIGEVGLPVTLSVSGQILTGKLIFLQRMARALRGRTSYGR